MNTALLGGGIRIPPTAATAATSKAASAADSQFSFHDLLDIVNPLQHLPVIGTIYRAITGEHIGKFEKVAGDALYGGLWGAVSSVADLAFEAVTGKDFGNTVLSLLTGHHDAKAQVAAADSKAASPAKPAAPPGLDVIALSNALAQNGVDSETAQRALFAYGQSSALPALALAGH